VESVGVSAYPGGCLHLLTKNTPSAWPLRSTGASRRAPSITPNFFPTLLAPYLLEMASTPEYHPELCVTMGPCGSKAVAI